MTDFLTWSYITTFIGIVFCTQMLVEFFKELPFIKSIPTKYFTAIVAFVLILFGKIFVGDFSLIDIPLILLNSVLVTFTTTGGKDFNYKKVTIKEYKEDVKNNLK